MMGLKALTICVLACVLIGCAGDSHEKVSTDSADLLDQVAEVLSTVEDNASAQEALDQINELKTEARAIRERAEALETPDDETARALEEKHRPLISASMTRVDVQIDRIFEVAPEFVIPLKQAARDVRNALRGR